MDAVVNGDGRTVISKGCGRARGRVASFRNGVTDMA